MNPRIDKVSKKIRHLLRRCNKIIDNRLPMVAEKAHVFSMIQIKVLFKTYVFFWGGGGGEVIKMNITILSYITHTFNLAYLHTDIPCILACSYNCILVWWHAYLVTSFHICILGN